MSAGRVRVCVIGSGFHFMSGISVHTCALTNALAERYDTSAILMRRLLPTRFYPGRQRVGQPLTAMTYRADVDVFDGVDYFWGPTLLEAMRFLRRHRPHVVLLQWWSGTVAHTYVALAALARSMGGRVIVEFHETLDPAELSIPGTRVYVRAVTQPLMPIVSGWVVHSQADVARVQRTFPDLVQRPVAVVPFGPYVDGVDTTAREIPTDGRFRLLYFGTIRPYKGVENLIRAFERLPARSQKEFSLTVVGETWEGWTLPGRLIETSPARERIHFENRYVSDAEAARFFRDADGVVLPYLRASMSGPLHLAMSHGLPIAVSAVGGLVEAVAGYSGARLVRPGDVDDLAAAIVDLTTMPGPHPDPHSWSRTVDHLEALLVAPPGEITRRPRRARTS